MSAPTLERVDELINICNFTARQNNGAWVALALGTDDYNDLLAALRAYRETLTVEPNATAVAGER